MTKKESIEFLVTKDGALWSAERKEDNGKDMMEAPRGFGPTKIDAISDLITNIKEYK